VNTPQDASFVYILHVLRTAVSVMIHRPGNRETTKHLDSAALLTTPILFVSSFSVSFVIVFFFLLRIFSMRTCVLFAL